MSPTPEQITRKFMELDEQRGGYGEMLERLEQLDRVFGEVGQRCVRVVGGEKHACDYVLAGYLLDSRGGIPSLHPVIRGLSGGRAVIAGDSLLMGKGLGKAVEVVSSVNRESVNVIFRTDWRESYAIGERLVLNARTWILEVTAASGCDFPSAIVYLKKEDFDGEIAEAIAVKEAMVVALANAAGIKATDEASVDFPLLLEQLKRIEATK